MLSSDRLDREREHHDRLAAGLDPTAMPPVEFKGIDVAILDGAEPLVGKHVLDLACGDGSLTLELLARGATVTAVDLSPGMIAVAERRIALHTSQTATLIAAPAEALPIEDSSVDVVVGRFALHHLDLDRAAPEMARVLRPGGLGLFLENSNRNRLLMFAREHLAGRFGIRRFGTVDERPMGTADVEHLGRYFGRAEMQYPFFYFLSIFDRQVLGYRWRLANRLCEGLDHAVWRFLPFARKWSFHVVIYVRK
jgi:SAM-dependent methyltransferase